MTKEIDTSFITVTSDNLKETIMELTNGRGVDAIITACSVPAVQQLSLELLAMNGRVNFFGGLPKTKELVPLNSNLIHYKQLIVTGSARASLRQFRQCIKFIDQGLFKVSDLVTERGSIEKINDLFALAQKAEGLKNIVAFD